MQKIVVEKHTKIQQGLPLAIDFFSCSFQRLIYTVGSATAIAAEDLEISEMEMKRREIKLKTAEMA